MGWVCVLFKNQQSTALAWLENEGHRQSLGLATCIPQVILSIISSSAFGKLQITCNLSENKNQPSGGKKAI